MGLAAGLLRCAPRSHGTERFNDIFLQYRRAAIADVLDILEILGVARESVVYHTIQERRVRARISEGAISRLAELEPTSGGAAGQWQRIRRHRRKIKQKRCLGGEIRNESLE